MRRTRHRQAKSEQGGDEQRQRDAGDESAPAEGIEDLAEHGAADETAEEIAGEVDAARRAAIGGRRATDEAGRRGLSEEGADADQRQPGEDGEEVRLDQ